MDLKLKGLNAVITGATRGIGRMIAETYAAEGCNVAICARNKDQVSEAVQALSKKGVKVVGDAVDVSGDGSAYKAWIKNAGEQLGGIDIFISNVSAGGGKADEAGWRANFEADVLSTVRGVDAALPMLSKSKNGAIVVISTTAALEDFGGTQAYNSMKAALINYAANLSQALAPKGIRVNTVSPGPIYFKGGAWQFIENNMADFYKATLSKLPLGRFGSAEEVANAVVFLSSPASSFTTGTNLVVDGGFTKRVQY